MNILKRVPSILFILVLIYLLFSTFDNPHLDYYMNNDFIYDKGDAPDEVRKEVLSQLNVFQEGYTKRDLSQVEPFAKQLFSSENILILGTMPQEIFKGYERAEQLVYDDWYAWGDCTFLVDKSNVSSVDNVVWFSTIGYVKFDLSRFLVLPLRLTGVMVNENDVWRFRQLQFQFDLGLLSVLGVLILLIAWFIVRIISLVVVYIRDKRKNLATMS